VRTYVTRERECDNLRKTSSIQYDKNSSLGHDMLSIFSLGTVPIDAKYFITACILKTASITVRRQRRLSLKVLYSVHIQHRNFVILSADKAIRLCVQLISKVHYTAQENTYSTVIHCDSC
jgi:hypothetical protein